MTKRAMLLLVILLSVALAAGCKKDKKDDKKDDKKGEKKEGEKKETKTVSVEGGYTLDTAAMLKQVKEKVAKMPEKKRGLGKLMLAIIGSMKGELKLEAKGVATMTTTTKFMGKEKTKSQTGSWKMEGGKVLLTRKTKSGKEKTMKCDVDGKKLNCKADRDMGMVWIKK